MHFFLFCEKEINSYDQLYKKNIGRNPIDISLNDTSELIPNTLFNFSAVQLCGKEDISFQHNI